MISVAKPFLGEEEKQAVCEVLDSGMIASGSVVDEFQTKFADYIGARYGVATTSGTTALEVVLRSVGIGKGDKVLTTPFSFIASTNAIIYCGALPIFTDIDPHTFNISPALIEEKLKACPSIKAVLIVHLFGHPCDMDAILAICNKYGVLLIEDCAQAHGAAYKNKKVGSFGIASAFSFYPTKNMTTSEGGIVLTSDEAVAQKAKLLINHGMKVRYYHDEIGYNYRMTNIAAAIGLCQLDKLNEFNRRRNEIAEYYNKHIVNENIVLPLPEDDCYHCYHQYSVLVKNVERDKFTDYLNKNGIGFGVFYPLSIPEQACYEQYKFDTCYPVTDSVKKQIVSLPVHPQLTQQEVETVSKVINQFH